MRLWYAFVVRVRSAAFRRSLLLFVFLFSYSEEKNRLKAALRTRA